MKNLFNFEWQSPLFLLLFLLLIPLLIMDFRKKKSKGVLVPSISNMKQNKWMNWVVVFLKLTKYIILSALILAMSRPRTYSVSQEQDETKGVDIILTVDVSLSMLSRDLEPDRLTALKNIAKRFVDKRPNDRIGLVAYSGEAFTKVPVTYDHQVIIEELGLLNPMELQSGTAIGEGLSVAVKHLKASKAKSKIIILMTDGVDTIHNVISPQIGAQLAKDNDIKVYTIGIGTDGMALMPIGTDIFGDLRFREVEVQIDENTLKEIAEITGGQYFRATSNEVLEEVYNEINQLEKSNVKSNKIYNYQEYFRLFLWIALLFLVIDALMRWVIFKIMK
ncbi:MAG: VWA domain-containing protein [Flavobacteriales bacterium]|nr:MAG: VWA domain-containing protein [Flavobacteriales bacterium]